jgi:hypothetical protein
MMVRRWFSSLYYTVWRKKLMRSGAVTSLLLLAIVVGLVFAYQEHMRGSFHKLKVKIADDRQEIPVPRPGGQEALTLMRSRLMGDSMPEFVSATMLPGRGMNVLQIVAYVPGLGEVNLMASPPVESAANAMTGTGADANGRASMDLGSPFEVPWADSIWGSSAAPGEPLTTNWRGQAIMAPSMGLGSERNATSGGLLLAKPADSAGTTALPDGGQAEATFDGGDFGGQWPSRTQVTVTILLRSRSMEMTVVARNSGNVAEPIGIGWHPRFAIVGGNRAQLRLRVPGQKRVEVSDRKGRLPTGVLIPVAGSTYDFTASDGVKLGDTNLDDCFTSLRQDLLDSGPVAELSDPANNYGLRLTALSSTIKAIHVEAPAAGNFVSIEPQYNYPDPFGREWAKDSETGIVVLQPGQSTQWKVRLELFSLAGNGSQM